MPSQTVGLEEDPHVELAERSRQLGDRSPLTPEERERERIRKKKEWRFKEIPRTRLVGKGQKVSKALVMKLMESGDAWLDAGFGRWVILKKDDMKRRVKKGEMLKDLQVHNVVVRESRGREFLGEKTDVYVKWRRLVNTLRVGQKLRGKVTHVDGFVKGIWVDVGAMKDGLLLYGQTHQKFVGVDVFPGMEIECYVLDVDEDTGKLGLTMKEPLHNFRFRDELQGRVVKIHASGGVEVDVGAVENGWLNPWLARQGNYTDLKHGDNVTVYVYKISEEKGLRLSFFQPRMPFENLELGQFFMGKVTGVLPTGKAWVDIGSKRDALLHWKDTPFSTSLDENMFEGDEVEVWIKQLTSSRDDLVSLTMKRPTVAQADLSPGLDLNGTVVAMDKDGRGVWFDIGLPFECLARMEDIPMHMDYGRGDLQVNNNVTVFVKAVWPSRVDLTLDEAVAESQNVKWQGRMEREQQRRKRRRPRY